MLTIKFILANPVGFFQEVNLVKDWSLQNFVVYGVAYFCGIDFEFYQSCLFVYFLMFLVFSLFKKIKLYQTNRMFNDSFVICIAYCKKDRLLCYAFIRLKSNLPIIMIMLPNIAGLARKHCTMYTEKSINKNIQKVR